MEKGQRRNQNRNGFTLIEILVVVAIISILSIVVLVGLKPAKRLSEARDARRAQDLGEILTGIMSCALDKKDTATMGTCLGTYTTGDTYEIVNTGTTTGCNTVCTGATNSSHCLPLDVKLSDYFTSLPVDPNNTVSGHTGYSLKVMTNNMIVVEACAAENDPIITSR